MTFIAMVEVGIVVLRYEVFKKFFTVFVFIFGVIGMSSCSSDEEITNSDANSELGERGNKLSQWRDCT